MSKKIACILLLIICVFRLAGQEINADSSRGLQAEEFYIQWQSSSNVVLIDTRTWDEYSKERISGAILAENKEKLGTISDTLDLEQPVFIYCQEETRSITACMLLKEKGFTGAYYLKEGMTGWKQAGYETDRKKLKKKRSKI